MEVKQLNEFLIKIAESKVGIRKKILTLKKFLEKIK